MKTKVYKHNPRQVGIWFCDNGSAECGTRQPKRHWEVRYTTSFGHPNEEWYICYTSTKKAECRAVADLLMSFGYQRVTAEGVVFRVGPQR